MILKRVSALNRPFSIKKEELYDAYLPISENPLYWKSPSIPKTLQKMTLQPAFRPPTHFSSFVTIFLPLRTKRHFMIDS